MKTYRLYMVAALFTAVLAVVMTGCEFDVAQPQWNKDFTASPTPVINQIEPAHTAAAGVNFITIRGLNFEGVPDTNSVYFGVKPVEIVQKSGTAIVVRRPNLVTDSCTVKVVVDRALAIAQFGPYRIDPVLNKYGSFLDNAELSAVAVDNAENLYVMETSSKKIVKVTPDGVKTTVGTATRTPTDAKIGPDGNLYLVENNRAIDQVNLATGVVKRWTQLPSGKVAKFGDFDANGYFYTGGTNTDLVVVAPNLSVTSAGFYASDDIFAIHVYNDAVYVVSRKSNSEDPAKIWKHQIDANGNVGAQSLVLDMKTTGGFSSRLIRSMIFSSNGTLYLATDSVDPILVVDLATMQVDYFYKGIVPPYCKDFCWGSGNYIYMISGDAIAGQEWTVYRIDMGSTGA
ncbi:MAG TPA: IPT/TIG domain-containing protein [bacterium]